MSANVRKILLPLIGCQFGANAQLRISGIYSGNNLFFQNPEDGDGEGFCTDSITINGRLYTGEVNASAFELKLNEAGIQPGDSISIIIYHGEGCKPKLLIGGGCYFPPATTAAGLPILYFSGMPVYTDEQLNVVAKKYGVRFRNTGCKAYKGMEEMNRETLIYLEQKNGKGWQDRFWKEVEATYR